jgi:aarF domain-containing kinase
MLAAHRPGAVVVTTISRLLHDPLLRARRVAQTNLVVQKHLLRQLRGRRPPPQLLRAIFDDLGTTYVKIGQLVASMPSVFPREYVEAFQGCLDQTNPLPFRAMEKVLASELGDTGRYFRHIEVEPLASASIAQVHAATLLDGTEVVIKIQRPDADRILRADLSMLHTATRLLEMVVPGQRRLALADIVDEIRGGMLEECDFVQEAENLRIYAQFLEDLGTDAVRVPRVHAAASTRRVLTMERFRGVPLTDLAAVRRFHPSPEAALIEALNVWIASITRCRFYHADLHSGNIMMLESGQIGFIDFGIVGRIEEDVWEALMALYVALPREDFPAAARALMSMGATHDRIDTDALARDLEELYRSTMYATPGVARGAVDASADATLLQLAEIGKRYGIRFPRAFTLLVKQFLYFDRFIDALAPSLNFGDSLLNPAAADDYQGSFSPA